MNLVKNGNQSAIVITVQTIAVKVLAVVIITDSATFPLSKHKHINCINQFSH